MAWRNLKRNSRRTLLSVLGISVGCSVSLVNISFQKGKVDLFVRNVAEGGTGHFRIADRNWLETRDRNLRVKDLPGELDAVRTIPGVRVAAPHARLQGLLAMGTRTEGTEVVGVDPELEPRISRFARSLSNGRYLRKNDLHKIVVGRSLAQSLNSDVGDSLVLTTVDREGRIDSEMFEIVGLVNLGNVQMEKGFAQVNISDVREMTGLQGAGDITVLLKDYRDLDPVARSLKKLLPEGDLLFSWKEISSQVTLAITVNDASTNLLTFIFVLIAFLGVSSAQLTSVIERRREFAVLSALGTRGSILIEFIVTETFLLGTLSLIATLLITIPLALLLETFGIRVLGGSTQISVLGTALEPVIHGETGWWILRDALFLSYLSTLLSGIYPALFAAEVDPAVALRTAQ